MLGKQQRYIL